MKKFVLPVRKVAEPASSAGAEKPTAPVIALVDNNTFKAPNSTSSTSSNSNKRGPPKSDDANKKRKSSHSHASHSSAASNAHVETSGLCIIVEASNTTSGDWTESSSDMLRLLEYRPGRLPAFTADDASAWIAARPGVQELLSSKDVAADAMRHVLSRHGGKRPACTIKRDQSNVSASRSSSSSTSDGNTTTTCSSQTTSTHPELDDAAASRETHAITIPQYWGKWAGSRETDPRHRVSSKTSSSRGHITTTSSSTDFATSIIYAYMGVDACTQTAAAEEA